MRKILLTLMSLALVMLPGMALSTELVTNGGFETGSFAGWTVSGNTGFTGVSSGDVHSGSSSAFLGPVGSPGFISQTLPTVNGGVYDLSFWLQHDGGSPNEFQVFWAGNNIFDNTDPTAFGYALESVSNLTATGPTVVTFGFREDPAYYHLDDVSVTEAAAAVPEPATMLLLGSGLIGLAGYGRKKFFKK